MFEQEGQRAFAGGEEAGAMEKMASECKADETVEE